MLYWNVKFKRISNIQASTFIYIHIYLECWQILTLTHYDILKTVKLLLLVSTSVSIRIIYIIYINKFAHINIVCVCGGCLVRMWKRQNSELQVASGRSSVCRLTVASSVFLAGNSKEKEVAVYQTPLSMEIQTLQLMQKKTWTSVTFFSLKGCELKSFECFWWHTI